MNQTVYDACEPESDEERAADRWLCFDSGSKRGAPPPDDAPSAVDDYIARRKAAVQATWSKTQRRMRQVTHICRWSPPAIYTHHVSRQRSTAGRAIFSSTFKRFDDN